MDGPDAIPYFKTYRLGPHTAFNIARRWAVIETILTQNVQSDDHVMFCFGEVDCRAHLLKQSELQQRPLDELIDECVQRYFRIFLAAQPLGFKLMAWNVPPAARNEVICGEYSSYGTTQQRNDITRKFNRMLELRCRDNDILFISIFDRLVETDGLAYSYYYMDDIHLSQRAMPFALQELMRIGAIPKSVARGVETEEELFFLHPRLANALALFEAADYASACREFLIASTLGFNQVKVLWYAAQAAQRAGDFLLADNLVQGILDKNPRFDSAQDLPASCRRGMMARRPALTDNDHVAIAFHQALSQQFEDADSQIETAISDGGSAGVVYLSLALLLMPCARDEYTLQLLNKCLEHDSKNSDAHNVIGLLHQRRGDLGKAMESFGAALSINELHYDALRNILALSRKLGIGKSALAVIRNLLVTHPDDAKLLSIAQSFINELSSAPGKAVDTSVPFHPDRQH
jgi:tetratricopeptide (TPR) repeat protein